MYYSKCAMGGMAGTGKKSKPTGNYNESDFPPGKKVHIDDEVWLVVRPVARRGKVFMAPFNKVAKDRYISIAIEHDINWLNGNVTKIEE